eukprot:TRINITY_DN2227_c0_g1_i1.p1 TRINITY_DN2227_c0_g1~~TRINITY_DN2227_c0_g1_i1.p1  ORF type:complete len:378 (-),score=54.08 TRINITY_DN2227_c0_g1_i1:279-1337(-)
MASLSALGNAAFLAPGLPQTPEVTMRPLETTMSQQQAHLRHAVPEQGEATGRMGASIAMVAGAATAVFVSKSVTTRASRTRRSATEAGAPSSGKAPSSAKAGASSAKKVTLSASMPGKKAAATTKGGTDVAVKTAAKGDKAPSVKDVEKMERAYVQPSTDFAQGLLGGQGAFARSDYNFDPLGLSEKLPDAVPFFRESELKHGRVAMLAFVGMLAPDIGFTLPGLSESCANAGMGQDSYYGKTIEAHDACVVGDANGGLAPLMIVLIGAGLVEIVTTAQKVYLGWGLTLENAGDYPGRKEIGDFLGQTPKREDRRVVLRLQELKHARLAMLAFSGAVTQAALAGKGFPWLFN